MSTTVDFRKTFLIGLIVSLTLSALVGIGAFVLGSFGSFEFKILLTTLVVGLFSLTSLVNSILFEKKKYVGLALSGIVVSLVGFFLTEFLIWGSDIWSDLWKFSISSIILAIALAHIALVLLISSVNSLVKVSTGLTLICIVLITLMLNYLVFTRYPYPGEVFFRLLGVFAILDVLGTIVTPILKKVTSSPQVQKQTVS